MNTYEVNLKPEGNRKQKLIASIFPQISEENHFWIWKRKLLSTTLTSCIYKQLPDGYFLVTAENSNIQIISTVVPAA
jgi:hypothetical protein